MDTPPLLWHEPFRIRAYEVGPDEAASVLTIADLFQEAAGEHARAWGLEHFALPSGAGTWVLSRLRIRVASFPTLRQPVTVETWPSGRDGLRATRDFVLRDEAGAVLAVGTSVWLVIDVARRRPVRLPPGVDRFLLPDRPRALDEGAPLSTLSEGAASVAFRVRRSDLDRVGHANNVRFAEWALEAVPEPTALREIDLAYRAEAVAGDVVVSSVGPDAGGVRQHQLTRRSDGRLLALARSVWSPAL